MRRTVPSAVLATFLFIGACAARKPGEPLKPGFNMFSKEQDIQLGREAADQVRKQYQVVQNQFLQDYLQRIGRRLAEQPEAKEWPFSYTLLNEKSINAFALPGGPTFVFTGLLDAADNEAQLAGVIAHEMSHVILRHGTNQVSKANLLQLPAMLAGAVVGNGSLLGQLAQAGIGLGFNSLLLKFSRTDEAEADALGARLMAKAGFNPIEMAHFFEKLEAGGGSRAPEFLSDHPNPGNRIKMIEAEIRAMPQQNYGFQTGLFSQAKSQLGALPKPPANQGLRSSASAPNGAPAGGWQQLQGRNFSLSYPGNWQAFGDQQSSMITLAPRDGLVRSTNGNTEIGYGAMLSYFFPDSGTRDLRAATEDLIHHLRSSNPSMRAQSGSPRKVRIDGSEGLVTMLESQSPYGGAETDALVTVSRPEGVFYMIFIAPSQNYAQLQSAFEQMLKSIRFRSR